MEQSKGAGGVVNRSAASGESALNLHIEQEIKQKSTLPCPPTARLPFLTILIVGRSRPRRTGIPPSSSTRGHPPSLIYKCKVLIQVTREKWQC